MALLITPREPIWYLRLYEFGSSPLNLESSIAGQSVCPPASLIRFFYTSSTGNVSSALPDPSLSLAYIGHAWYLLPYHSCLFLISFHIYSPRHLSSWSCICDLGFLPIFIITTSAFNDGVPQAHERRCVYAGLLVCVCVFIMTMSIFRWLSLRATDLSLFRA